MPKTLGSLFITQWRRSPGSRGITPQGTASPFLGFGSGRVAAFARDADFFRFGGARRAVFFFRIAIAAETTTISPP